MRKLTIFMLNLCVLLILGNVSLALAQETASTASILPPPDEQPAVSSVSAVDQAVTEEKTQNNPPVSAISSESDESQRLIRKLREQTEAAEQALKAIEAPAEIQEATQSPSARPITSLQAVDAIPPSNQGIDMNLKPELVGADKEEQTPEQEFAALPYEEQLRIRTKEIDQQARTQAFEGNKNALLPLESYEIRDLLRRLRETQEAIQTPIRKPPKVKNVVRTISTDPSVPPQQVNLAVRNVTAMSFVDVTGAPWPIVDISYGGEFDIKAPEPGGHIIRITPLREFARGNMIIRLLRLDTPLTFELRAGGDDVNYRFDARIPTYGPGATVPLIRAESIDIAAGDILTTSILEGVPPANAEKLQIAGVDGRTSAYRVNGILYLRTPLSLLSPAWRGSATSADGMNVYVLAEAPVLLLSDKGSLVRARLSIATPSGG